jgi:hypothetical protein
MSEGGNISGTRRMQCMLMVLAVTLQLAKQGTVAFSFDSWPPIRPIDI